MSDDELSPPASADRFSVNGCGEASQAGTGVADGGVAGAASAAPASRWKRWWANRPLRYGSLAGGLVLLAWGGLAGASTAYVLGDSTAGGVSVVHMSASEAEAAVTSGVGEQLAQPVTVTVGQLSDELIPADSGVSVDAAATVKQLTGFTLNPATLVQRVVGTEVPARTTVDSEALTSALNRRLTTLAEGAVNARVELQGSQPVLVPSIAGVGLNVEDSVVQLQNWPLGQSNIALAEGIAEPAITDAKAQQVIDTVLTPLLSDSLTVTAAGTEAAAAASGDLVLSPEQTAGLTVIDNGAEAITVSLSEEGLREAARSAMGTGIEVKAVNAGYTISGDPSGQPQYIEPKDGTTIDTAALATSLLEAGKATGSEQRRVTLPVVVEKPEHGGTAAELGVTQIVGEYATPYYHDPQRTTNLINGTAKINGTVVYPGETFSLNDALGEITLENGYVSSGVLLGAIHSDALGGGLSQVATTTFNAGFEAGMDDVEHQPHTAWFTRYPAGREATIWTGYIDVKWKNSTPYAVLVQAWAADGKVHVRLWSSPYYSVSIDNGTPTNYRPVQTRTSNEVGCQPYPGGEPGFDITVTRNRTKPDGSAMPMDVLNWSYAADDALRCMAHGEQ